MRNRYKEMGMNVEKVKILDPITNVNDKEWRKQV